MTYQDPSGYQFALPRLTSAVKLLLLVNAGVFVVHAIAGAFWPGWFSAFFGASWTGLWDGYGLGLLRLVTYQFAHSFESPLHILFNMLVLYFFGTLVEGGIGPERLFRLYLGAGLLGGVGFVLVSGLQGVDAHVIGASGACYGIMVYAACMAPRMRVIFIIFPIELRWLVGALVALGLYQTYVEMVLGTTAGVAHSAHLGGALYGFLAYRMPSRQWGLAARVGEWRARRRAEAARDKQRQLDALLEKVHREGISALTAAERRFLDRASQEMRRK